VLAVTSMPWRFELSSASQAVGSSRADTATTRPFREMPRAGLCEHSPDSYVEEVGRRPG
jgi:hypothetical protein